MPPAASRHWKRSDWDAAGSRAVDVQSEGRRRPDARIPLLCRTLAWTTCWSASPGKAAASSPGGLVRCVLLASARKRRLATNRARPDPSCKHGPPSANAAVPDAQEVGTRGPATLLYLAARRGPRGRSARPMHHGSIGFRTPPGPDLESIWSEACKSEQAPVGDCRGSLSRP